MLAKYFLNVSVEAGGQKAYLDLWQLAEVMGEDPQPRTQKAIHDAAENQHDWRAMQLYIRQLNKRNRDKGDCALAFELALDLNSMVGPGSWKGVGAVEDDEQKHSPHFFSRPNLYVSPWELLKDAAIAYANDHPEGSEEHIRAVHALKQALRDGVEKYNSPDAMKFWADHPSIELFSEQWVNLKTRAAMSGDLDSCLGLGRYWLEKSGWYPCQGKARLNEEGRAALSWWLLGANQSVHDADAMGRRYLVVALVLRENGFKAEGLEWLRYGIDTMQETCEDTASRKAEASQSLKPIERRWNQGDWKAAGWLDHPEPMLPRDMRP